MFAQTLMALFTALFIQVGDAPAKSQLPAEIPADEMEKADICSKLGDAFLTVYEMHGRGTEKEVVAKAILDQVYDQLDGRLGAEVAFVLNGSINALYAVPQIPTPVNWFYMTQLYCVNTLGTDILADQRADFLGKPKQRTTEAK